MSWKPPVVLAAGRSGTTRPMVQQPVQQPVQHDRAFFVAHDEDAFDALSGRAYSSDLNGSFDTMHNDFGFGPFRPIDLFSGALCHDRARDEAASIRPHAAARATAAAANVWDNARLEAWMDGVRATMRIWIDRYFAPGGGFEFLWRARFKPDLVQEFIAHEPWIARADKLMLRDLLIESLGACGYTCVLANVGSRKERVTFPDGTVHRVSGVVTGIRPL